jgi:hypothetical protein
MPSPDQLEHLFHEALNHPEGPERTQWLADRCTGDAELLKEVTSLLEARPG